MFRKKDMLKYLHLDLDTYNHKVNQPTCGLSSSGSLRFLTRCLHPSPGRNDWLCRKVRISTSRYFILYFMLAEKIGIGQFSTRDPKECLRGDIGCSGFEDFRPIVSRY